MILSGRLCEQSAIALVSDTIIHHKNTKRLCSFAQTEPVGDGVFWLFSEPVRGVGFYYLTQQNIPVVQILQHQKNNIEVIFTTLQTHAMITISSENFFSPNTSIAVRLSSRVSISETKSDMKNNKIFKMEENAYDKQTATVFPYDSDERTTNGRDRGKTKTKINFL